MIGNIKLFDGKESGLSSISARINGGEESYLSGVARMHQLFITGDDGLGSPTFNTNKLSGEGGFDDSPYSGFQTDHYTRLAANRLSNLDGTVSSDIAEQALRRAVEYEAVDGIQQDVSNLIQDSTRAFRRVFSHMEMSSSYGLFAGRESLDDERRGSLDMMSRFAGGLVGRNELSDVMEWGDHALNSIIERDIRDAPKSSYRIASELDRRVGGIVDGESASGLGLTVAKRILSNTEYISRPGIAPLASLIQSAEGELNIDLYQLQNSSIQNLLTTKILASPDLRVNVRVAYTGNNAQGKTAFDILGPNAVVIKTLQALKEVRPNVNVVIGEERSHSKFSLSEQFAILGTQNATQSIGRSLYQSGSNYEALRVLKNTLDGKSLGEVNDVSNSDLRGMGSEGADVILYRQARELMGRTFEKGGVGRISESGLENVVSSKDIYKHLKDTVALGVNNTAVRSVFNLDQVFLLQYDEQMMAKYEKGEFGEFDPATKAEYDSFGRGRMNEYRSTQIGLLEQVIEGRAQVVVDPRNYREGIQTEMFNRANVLLPNFDKHGYDLASYITSMGIDRFARGSVQISDLTSKLRGLGSFSALSDSEVKSFAVQALVNTSGSIHLASVPRQHIKEYAAYIEDAASGVKKFLSNMLSSSNFGAVSVGITDSPIEDKITSIETGLAFFNDEGALNVGSKRLRPISRSDFALSQGQVEEQLQKAGAFTLHNANELSGGAIQYTNVDRRASWEKNVDTTRLITLRDTINQLGNKVGLGEGFFKATEVFDSVGKFTHLELSLDSVSTAGVEGSRKLLKLTTLRNASGQDDGFIYAIGENKLIGRTMFVNSSSTDVADAFTGGVIAAGSRRLFSPMETLVGLIANTSLDMNRNFLIEGPAQEYRDNYSTRESMNSGVIQYMLDITGQSKGTLDQLLDPNVTNEAKIFDSFYRKMGLKLTNGNAVMDRIRLMSDADINSESRVDLIGGTLSNMVHDFAKGDMAVRKEMILGKAGQGIGTFGELFSHMIEQKDGVWSDFLYDFIDRQRSDSYQQKLQRGMQEKFRSMFDVFLSAGEARTYGSSQAMNKVPIYGVTASRNDWINSVNSSDDPLSKLFAYAFTSSPFEYNSGVSLGKGSGVYIRGVAEGGSSREKRGVSNLMLSAFNGKLMQSYQHEKVGDVTDIRIIEDTSTGFIVSEKRLDNYLDYLRGVMGDGDKYREIAKNAREKANEFEGDIYIFNFSDASKLYQIPQRLKNVIGSRPLYDLSVSYQELLEGSGKDSVKYRGVFDIRAGSFKDVNSISELRSAYLDDLRYGLEKELSKVGRSTTEIKQFVSRITDDLEVGAFYSGKLKTFMSESMMAELNNMAAQQIDEYGIDASTEIGAELLRVRALNLGFDGSGIKGFIGSSQRSGRPDVMLLQLTGAYSDPFFANPDFGGKKGIRQAYPDRAVKSNKSSMFSANLKVNEWDASLEGLGYGVMDSLKVGEGEIVKFDKNGSGKAWVYKKDSNGIYQRKPGGLIDDRSQHILLEGVIESMGRNPSIANLEVKSFIKTAISEAGIESLRGVRVLAGSPNTNEVEIELLFDRSRMPGGGSRFAAHGGLFKGVAAFAYGSFFENEKGTEGLIPHMNKMIGSKNAHLNFLFGGAEGAMLKTEQVIGLASPSNLKSYFFEHGATVLTHRDQSIIKGLINKTDTKLLAFSLLSQFGSDLFDIGGDTNLYKNLGKSALDGEFGEFYKTAASREIFNLSGDFDIGVSGRDSLHERVGRSLVSNFAEKDKKNPLLRDIQFNVLKGVSGSDLINIFSHGQGSKVRNDAEINLRSYLEKVLVRGDFYNSTVGGDMRLINSMSGREAAVIAGALHIAAQQSASSVVTAKTFDIHNDSTYEKLGSIMGMTRQEMQGDKLRLKEFIDAAGNSFTPVAIFMSGAFSQSQLPVSSRKGANLEAQHIVPDSFALQGKAFAEGGTVHSLRTLMANYLGSIANAAPAQMMKMNEGMRVVDLTGDYGTSVGFRSKMIGVYAGFDSESVFIEYKNKYQIYNLIYTLAANAEGVSDVAELRKLMGDIVSGVGVKRKVALVKPDALLESKIKTGTMEEVLQYAKMKSAEVTDYFHQVEKEFSLRPDKSLSIDFAQGVTKAMKSAGSETFGYSIPKFEFIPQEGKVRVYKSQKVFGISLGGSDLAALGEQFGDFLSEEQKAMTKIWRGIAPGGSLSRVWGAIHNLEGGDMTIAMSMEEMEELRDFTRSTEESVGMINSAVVGRRNQQIFGNKIGVDGGVYTAASTFFMPDRVNAQPEAVIDAVGGRKMPMRNEMLSKINKSRSKVYQAIDYISSQSKDARSWAKTLEWGLDLYGKRDKFGNIAADEVEEGNVALKHLLGIDDYHELTGLMDLNREELKLPDYNLKRLQNKSDYLKAVSSFITDGISAGGEGSFLKLVNNTSDLKESLKVASSSTDTLVILSRIEDLSKMYSANRHVQSGVEGDAFIQEVAIRQMDILKADALAKRDSFDVEKGGKLTNKTIYAQRWAKFYRSEFYMPFAPTGDNGESILDVGVDYKGAKSLMQRSSEIKDFRGAIRDDQRFESSISDERKLTGSTNAQKNEQFAQEMGFSREGLSAKALAMGIDSMIETSRSYESDILSVVAEEDRGIFTEFSNSNKRLGIRLEALKSKLSGEVSKSTLGYVRDRVEDLSSEFLIDFHLASNMAERSAPPGNLQQLFSTFRNITLKGLDSVLEKVEGVGLRFSPSDGRDSRNITLGLQNPISMLVSMLGDFDGDAVLTIADHSIKSRVQLTSISKELEFHKSSLMTIEGSINNAVGDELVELTEQKQRLVGTVSALEERKVGLQLVVSKVDSYFSDIKFNEAARKWFSAYAKVDERFFVSSDGKDSRGRSGWAVEDISPTTLFTYIEQGKGLTPGLENIWEGVRDSAFNAVRAISDEMGLSTARGSWTSESLDKTLDNLVIGAKGKSIGSIYAGLKNADEKMKSNLLGILNSGSEVRYVADMFSASKQNEAGMKMITQAFGAGIDADRFEMMNQVLGEAGSVVLGQTYNSLIGTLYAESPVLSVANTMMHIAEQQPDMVRGAIAESMVGEYLDSKGINRTADQKKVLADRLRRSNGDLIDSKLETMRGQARDVSYNAQRLGGFLQSVNQLMRDSIKLKGGEDFLGVLSEQLDKYKSTDDEAEKKEIVKSMAGNLGSGSGLRALMQLEEFNSSYTQLRFNGGEENTDLIRKSFGISSEMEDSFLKVLGYGQLGLIHSERAEVKGVRSGVNNRSLNSADLSLAAYKTKIDLVSQVSAFAFERNFEKGGSNLGGNIVEGINRRTRDNYEDYDEFERLKEIASEIYKGVGNLEDRQLHNLNSVDHEHIGMLRSMLDYSKIKDGKRSMGFEERHLDLYVSTYIDTKKQIEGFAGAEGEGLLNIAEFNTKVTAAKTGNLVTTMAGIAGSSWAENKDGLVMAVATAAVTGKLDESTISSMALTLTDAYKGQVAADATESQILTHVMKGMIGGGGTTFNNAEVYSEFTSLITGVTQGGTVYGSKLMDQVSKQIRNTFFGQVAKTVGANIKSAREATDINGGTIEHYLVNELKIDRDIAQRYSVLMSRVDTEGNREQPSIEDYLRYAQIENHGKLIKAPQLVRNNFLTGSAIDKAVLNKNSGNMAEMLLLPMIGILGQALASGSMDIGVAQQIAGNSMSMIGYMSPHHSTGNMIASTVSGVAFKGRMALQESGGDAGEAYTKLFTRELAMGLTGRLLTQPITNGINRAFGYRGSTMDVDKLEGARGIASSIVGMLSTAVLGMVAGETAVQFVKPGGTSVIAMAIQAAFDYNSRINEDSDEEQPYEIQTEFGEDVEYSSSSLMLDDTSGEALGLEDSVSFYSGSQDSNDDRAVLVS